MKILRLPWLHLIPAFIVLYLALVWFSDYASVASWRIFLPAAFFFLLLSTAWLVGFSAYWSRRGRSGIPAEPVHRAFLRWSIIPASLAVMVFSFNIPLVLLTRFAFSYRSLVHYVRYVETTPPTESHLQVAGTFEWYNKNNPDAKVRYVHAADGREHKVGQFDNIGPVYVLQNGDVKIVTYGGTCDDDYAESGIAYAPSHHIDEAIHIFGPWYYWTFLYDRAEAEP